MNLSNIKDSIAEIITLLGELYEEAGQSGDTWMAEEFDKDLKEFKEWESVLNGFNNTEVADFVLLRELKQHIPSFDAGKLSEYLGIVKEHKEHQVSVLSFDIDKISSIVDILEADN